MEFSWPQRRIGHFRGGALFFAGMLILEIALGQLPSAPISSQSGESKPAEVIQDSLSRTTPRGTVLGFLSACYDGKYGTAVQYLNTRTRGDDAITLAKELFFVLDRKLPAKLNNVSNDPLGSISNPIDSRRELIGTVVTETGSTDIYLERVDRRNAPSIWLFSRDTLVNIPRIYKEINAVTVENLIPDFLLRRFFKLTLFGWSYFFIVLPLVYLILSLLNRLLGATVGFTLRHLTRRAEIQNPTILPHPIRVLIVSLTVYATLSTVSLSLLARQVGSTVALLILIVGLVWTMFLVDEKCEAYVRKRMQHKGRLSSTAVLRLGRRLMDFIVIVIGLMFALHSLGINPTAALAGLGVGGIAVALAAQKTLENVIGGVSLILDGAVHVGDFFKIGEVLGTIEAVGLRSTRVRTLDRTIITIPNGQVATMTLENYSARDQFWLRHLISLRYQTPSSKLNTVLSEARTLLERDPRVLPSTARVRLLRFAEYSLELEVFAYVAARDWNQFLETQEELLMSIREALLSAGVEIAYPARSVYLKNETGADDQQNPLLKKTAMDMEAVDEMPTGCHSTALSSPVGSDIPGPKF